MQSTDNYDWMTNQWIGMVIGARKDQVIIIRLREKAYTVDEIQYQESTGKYEVLI